MSENVQAATAAVKEAKKGIERTEVKMEDGTTLSFPGSRQVDKSYEISPTGRVTWTFAFRNGAVRMFHSEELSEDMLLRAIGHGIVQKVGDEWSGVKDIEDIVLTADEIIGRLKAGEWGTVREGGDSMAGAGIVIRAICEVNGKTPDFVKTFLKGKLDAAKKAVEAGNPAAKLTRQDLYNSFRNPTTPTGKVIKRMEEEKLAKSTKVNAADVMAEMEQQAA